MTIRTPIPPDIPGRGTWSTQGGLLRLKPDSTNKAGFYRLNSADAGELMVGSQGAKAGATYSQAVVHLGVMAFQRILKVATDGFLGRQTAAAIVAFQAAHPDETGAADGVIGPRTARAIFTPLIRLVSAAHGVPIRVLGGITGWESSFDPAAVGAYNGLDTGLCQINLGAHDVTMQDATDPQYALNWTAADLRAVHDRWVGKTDADPWDIAIAHHNSPAQAKLWAETGEAPFSQSREDKGFPQISEYVASVYAAW